MSSNAAELLEEVRRLLELRGENPFKVRAYEKAIDTVSGRMDLLERARAGTLTELPGIGQGIADVLTEFLVHGHSSIRDELAQSIPPALLELTKIPGLGPKKAKQLIDELGISSIGELEYACRENRLLKVKGFGEKVQQKILDAICFHAQGRGKQRLADAFVVAEKALHALQTAAQGHRISETGELRRRLEIVNGIDFLLDVPAEATKARNAVEGVLASFRETLNLAVPIRLHFSEPDRFGYELARTTASPSHWKAIGAPAEFSAPTEQEFYDKLGIAWIPPEARETGEEVGLARRGELNGLLPWEGVRGIFHNHTTMSDGKATLEEMVVAAKKLGFSYIGISDHSQSAFYAQGLKPDRLLEQEKEIRKVQEKHPEIRVFWGIESDILADGSLDYEPKILKRFDFVVASIHSRFKMDRQQMTERVLSAIRDPHTRFIGHLTGRLLLERSGFELDMEKVIAEAAAHDVALEINSHPMRLEIDWRFGPSLRRHGTKVSINPDAHDTEGLKDVRYGVAMARKALLPSALVVNSGSVEEVERWLMRR